MEKAGLLQEDSPVRTSASPEKEQELPEQGLVFGLNIGELLGSYDQDSQSWKTWEHSLFGGLMPFSARFPKSGIMRNGKVYGVVNLDCRTDGLECGLLPTPQKLALISQWKSAEYLLKNNGRRVSGVKVGANLSWLLTKWHLQNGGKKDRIIPDPCFYEMMMGYPEEWTDLADSEMRLSLK